MHISGRTKILRKLRAVRVHGEAYKNNRVNVQEHRWRCSQRWLQWCVGAVGLQLTTYTTCAALRRPAPPCAALPHGPPKDMGTLADIHQKQPAEPSKEVN